MKKRQKEAEEAYEAQWDGGKGSHHPDFDPEAVGDDVVKASRETEVRCGWSAGGGGMPGWRAAPGSIKLSSGRGTGHGQAWQARRGAQGSQIARQGLQRRGGPSQLPPQQPSTTSSPATPLAPASRPVQPYSCAPACSPPAITHQLPSSPPPRQELYNAIVKNDIKLVYKKIEEGADVNFVFGRAYRCAEGYTPLMVAAHRGRWVGGMVCVCCVGCVLEGAAGGPLHELGGPCRLRMHLPLPWRGSRGAV